MHSRQRTLSHSSMSSGNTRRVSGRGDPVVATVVPAHVTPLTFRNHLDAAFEATFNREGHQVSGRAGFFGSIHDNNPVSWVELIIFPIRMLTLVKNSFR